MDARDLSVPPDHDIGAIAAPDRQLRLRLAVEVEDVLALTGVSQHQNGRPARSANRRAFTSLPDRADGDSPALCALRDEASTRSECRRWRARRAAQGVGAT